MLTTFCNYILEQITLQDDSNIYQIRECIEKTDRFMAGQNEKKDGSLLH